MLTNEQEKQKWADKQALRMGRRFEQWQRPLGIDCEEYVRYLSEELKGCCDEPLRQAFIESISQMSWEGFFLPVQICVAGAAGGKVVLHFVSVK